MSVRHFKKKRVFESIRFFMVRSKTVHHFFQKMKIYFLKIICYYGCIACMKKSKKSCDARFFRSKTVHQIFFDFLKKVKKMGKSAFFPLFFLWSQSIFYIFALTVYHVNLLQSAFKKECKKKGFSFLKLFFIF